MKNLHPAWRIFQILFYHSLYLMWESKHLQCLSLSNFPELLTVFTAECLLLLSRLHFKGSRGLPALKKCGFGCFHWLIKEPGLLWQECLNATAPGSQALKTWIPSMLQQSQVATCTGKPDTIWCLTSYEGGEKGKRHICSNISSCFLPLIITFPPWKLTVAHRSFWSFHIAVFCTKSNQQTDSLLRCDAPKDSYFIVFIIKHTQHIVCEVSTMSQWHKMWQ